MKIDLSIVVPAYNEKDNLNLIIQRFDKISKNARLNSELIIVDNGSNDGTKEFLEQNIDRKRNIKTLRIDKNIGYGDGIYNGLKYAKGEYIAWTHADLQTDIKDAFRAYKLTENKKNVVVKGNRIKRPINEKIFTIGMAIFESIFFCKHFKDINAQPNLFHRDFLKKIDNPPTDFSFDLYFYYLTLKNNYKIIRFPVLFNNRIYGKSKWNISIKSKFRLISRIIKYSFELRRKMNKSNNS